MSIFEQDHNEAHYQIKSYQPGVIDINHQLFKHSVIISSSHLTRWNITSVDQLNMRSFDEIITLKPDILLIGTGSRLVFPDLETYGHLINNEIGVEIMNTAAACRTFSALSSELRNVVAALIL